MADTERILHTDDDDVRVLHSDTDTAGQPDPVYADSQGHPDPFFDVHKYGSVNASNSMDTDHRCYQRLSASVSTTSSIVPSLHVYRRRWYILFLFTFLSFIQVDRYLPFLTVFYF